MFNVGDRVYAISGPINTDHTDFVGPGTIVAIRPDNGFNETHLVDLDMGESGWWFSEDQLRRLIPERAITINPTDPPTTVADLTTPKPKAGDHVRLTGVVVNGEDPKAIVVCIQGAWKGVTVNPNVMIPIDLLEIIRQPFKRGEVVRYKSKTDMQEYVVVEDEETEKDNVILASRKHGMFDAKASHFERRP